MITAPEASRPSRTVAGVAAWVALLLALLFQAAVVLPEALQREAGYDFRHFYVAGLTFLGGGNPYDGLQAEAAWQRLETGLPRHVAPIVPVEYGTAYPPILAFLFAPVAMLPYGVARVGWLGVNLACLAWLIARSLGAWASGWAPPARVAAVAAALLLDPVRQCLGAGQLTLVVVGLALAAADAEDRGRPRVAGVLYALAMVKFTCVLLIPVWLVVRRRWITAAWLILALVVLDAVPILIIGPAEFVAALRDTVALVRAIPINDPANVLGSYNVVSIDTLIYRVGHALQLDAAPALVPLIGAGALASLWPVRRLGSDPARAVAWLLLACLPCFNHRTYDAVVLVPTLFLLPSWTPDGGARRWLAYACIVPFLWASPYETLDPFTLTTVDVLFRQSYRNWALLVLWGLVGASLARGGGIDPRSASPGSQPGGSSPER